MREKKLGEVVVPHQLVSCLTALIGSTFRLHLIQFVCSQTSLCETIGLSCIMDLEPAREREKDITKRKSSGTEELVTQTELAK